MPVWKIVVLILIAFVGLCVLPFGFLLLLIALVCYAFPKIGCVLLNPLKVLYYLPVDIYYWIVHKEYNRAVSGVIVGLSALFGRGKTLTGVHIVANMYLRKNGKLVYCRRRNKLVRQRIRILSNVDLLVPYEKLVSMKQVVDAPKDNREFDDKYELLTVTLILLDEASVQMNSREFKNNIDALLLNSILTCRHHYIAIYYTAQRFKQVDALLRQVTSYCIECLKTWRLQGLNYYDAWEMENATTPLAIQPYKKSCWFVRNQDYEMYDTLACVENLTKSYEKGDMLSEFDILQLQGEGVNNDNIVRPSRGFMKKKKKMYK